MVDGLQKPVEPLHISEDPTLKMVGGNRFLHTKKIFGGIKIATQNSRMIFVTR